MAVPLLNPQLCWGLLIQRETFALAGEWYRWWIGQYEENPGEAHDWEGARWAFEDVLEEAARDPETGEIGNLDLSDPKTRAYVVKHAPYLIETAGQFLTDRGEALSPAAMTSFLESVASNLHATMVVSERRAKGDYSPDRHLPTLPTWRTESSAWNVSSLRDVSGCGQSPPLCPAAIRGAHQGCQARP